MKKATRVSTNNRLFTIASRYLLSDGINAKILLTSTDAKIFSDRAAGEASERANNKIRAITFSRCKFSFFPKVVLEYAISK